MISIVFLRHTKRTPGIHRRVKHKNYYVKFSKISNTFLVLFSNEVLFFRAGIHKMLIGIANREDPDQTASSEAV